MLQLGGAGAYGGRHFARHNARAGCRGCPQALHAHAVADVEPLHFLTPLGIVYPAIGEYAVAIGENQANAAGPDNEVGMIS